MTASMSTNQAAKAFGVSTMTLYLWRLGTPTKEPLPFKVSDPLAKKPRVIYEIAATKQWARRHGIVFAFDPAEVCKEPNKRPGPVAKSKPKSKANTVTKSKSTAKSTDPSKRVSKRTRH